MKKLVKKANNDRDSVIALSSKVTCACGCGCPGNCSCPVAPTHQIGINVSVQGKDSIGNRNNGANASYGV